MFAEPACSVHNSVTFSSRNSVTANYPTIRKTGIIQSGGWSFGWPIPTQFHDHENTGFVYQGNHAGDRNYSAYAGAGEGGRDHLGGGIFCDDRDHSWSRMGGAHQLFDCDPLSGDGNSMWSLKSSFNVMA